MDKSSQIKLSEGDSKIFIDAIQNPKSPNQDLTEAVKYLKDKNMTQKFIKFTTGSDELYVIPHMISHIRKTKAGKAIIYLFNGQSLHVNENADEVLKLIKDSDSFRFNF